MLSKKSPCQTWKENSVEMKIAQLVVELYAVFCARAGTVGQVTLPDLNVWSRILARSGAKCCG